MEIQSVLVVFLTYQSTVHCDLVSQSQTLHAEHNWDILRHLMETFPTNKLNCDTMATGLCNMTTLPLKFLTNSRSCRSPANLLTRFEALQFFFSFTKWRWSCRVTFLTLWRKSSQRWRLTFLQNGSVPRVAGELWVVYPCTRTLFQRGWQPDVNQVWLFLFTVSL